MTYSIQIYDNKHEVIGELMTASVSDILKLINKGFHVVDKLTGNELTEAQLTSMIGVSDGLING
jgi:hypothetical protein